MTWQRHEPIRFLLVVGLAFAVRLAFIGIWQHTHAHDPHQFEFPDSAGYWELGQHLAAGETYQFGTPDRRVHRAPGYPLLLAAMFRLVGQDASPTSARVLGATLGAFTVGAIYWLARQIFGTQVAWLSATIVALYPEAIAISVLPLSDGPFCLWMTLQLAVWRWATNQKTSAGVGLALLAGALAGAASLTRPSWLLFTPLFAALWWFAAKFDRRQLLFGGAMLLGLAATMTPWWNYTHRAVGRIVATTLWVGPSLYDGLSPTADGSSDMRFVAAFEDRLRAADTTNPPTADAPPFEVRYDRLMRDEALRWAADHPAQALRLAGVKLLRMWNVWPNESQFRSWFVRLVIVASYTPIMLLAAFGAWRFRHQRCDMLLLLLPAVYFSLIHAVFIGSLRYRQPAMLTLAILAAAALATIFERYRKNSAAPQPVRAS